MQKSGPVDLSGVLGRVRFEILDAAFTAELHFLAFMSDNDGISHAAEGLPRDGTNGLLGHVASMVALFFFTAGESECGCGDDAEDE